MAVYELKTPSLLPAGVYSADVVSAEEVTTQYGEQVRFTFRVTHDGENHILSAWCNAVYTPRSKLAKWAQALLGALPKRLDLADLEGKPCLLLVEQGGEYSKVREVLSKPD